MVSSPRPRRRRALSIRATLAVTLSAAAMPVWAQDLPVRPDRTYPGVMQLPDVIVPQRRGAVAGVQPERSLLADGIAAYGFNSIRELTDALAREAGEDDPVILVNGQRIDDFEDVADFPVEALERVDILPPGSGARVGASPRGRVINVVLKPEFRTAVLTGSLRAATEGSHLARSGEANLTRIQGPNRVNLVVRMRDDDWLLESDRSVASTVLNLPYGVFGTVLPDPRFGAVEIDPALSAAAGQPVFRAAVPAGASPGTLAAFVGTAGQTDVLDLGRYRTLIPSARSSEAILNVAQQFSDRLRGSVNARLGMTDNRFLSSPAYGLFLLPADHPDSPFSTDVAIAAARAEPLRSRSRSDSAQVSGGLNLSAGLWTVGVLANYARTERTFDGERRDLAAGTGLIPIANGFDPFGGELGSLLTISNDQSRNRNQSSALQVTAFGPAANLPAGPLRLTLGGGVNQFSVESRSTSQGQFARRDQSRSELGGSAIVAIPLTSRRADVLPAIGDLDATFEIVAADSDASGSSGRINAGLNWILNPRLRFNASVQESRTPPPLELLAAAPVSSPDTPYLDALTGTTANVLLKYGGNPDLRPTTATTHRLGLNAVLWPEYNLQLNAEYQSVRTSNAVSGLPPISAAVMQAFPDLFIRDSAGVLTQVDIRPINFERQDQEQLRYGLIFHYPVFPEMGARLEVAAGQLIVFQDEIVIREGLPVIDALRGGGLGFPGGRVRRRSDASVALTSADWGARVSSVWNGSSSLTLGTGATSGGLMFEPFMTTDATVFISGKLFAPDIVELRKTRLTLTVNNLSNVRQAVRSSTGPVPASYQPVFRSPLGRSVSIELRVAF